MSHEPDEIVRAKLKAIIRERKPRTRAEWEAVAADIPWSEVLAAMGIPEQPFLDLSPAQRGTIADLVFLQGMSWQEAWSRIVEPAGEA